MTLLKTLYEKDLYPEIEDAGSSDFAKDCIEIGAAKLARGEIDRRTFVGALAAMGALLMSEEGSFINGQMISVNGGAAMRP